MEAYEGLIRRRSVRKYKPDPISPDVLERIVNAGRLAPTGRNVQPWEFVVVTDDALRNRLAELSEYGKFIAEAPACIAVLCRDTKYYLEDGSAATTNILNAAAAFGLGSCWVAGDKKPYADAVVNAVGAPADLKLVALIAIGYAQEIREPAKRPLAELLHWQQFGRHDKPV